MDGTKTKNKSVVEIRRPWTAGPVSEVEECFDTAAGQVTRRAMVRLTAAECSVRRKLVTERARATFGGDNVCMLQRRIFMEDNGSYENVDVWEMFR